MADAPRIRNETQIDRENKDNWRDRNREPEDPATRKNATVQTVHTMDYDRQVGSTPSSENRNPRERTEERALTGV